MRVLCLGLNYKTAPVEVRERLTVAGNDLGVMLGKLSAGPGLRESMLLSTCNRTEIYAATEGADAGVGPLLGFMVELAGMPGPELRPHLYIHEDLAAVRHLLRVACGLDSMILGETQILGQVRAAYIAAAQAGNVGKVLHQAASLALATGKRAQTETMISRNPISVSYAAVELARKVFGSLRGRRAMVIGAGEMAELTLRHLQAAGIAQMVFVNRTWERAVELARSAGGVAVPLAEMVGHLGQVDVVISSTGAPDFVVKREAVQEALRGRRGRPLFLIDIAVPRDIDPGAGGLEGVFLYDIDDLQSVVAANLQERAREAQWVEKIIGEEVEKFSAWLRSLEVVPAIRQLREKVEDIRRQEVERLLQRLPDLTDHQRQLIILMSQQMVNKILNNPTQKLKGLAEEGEAQSALDALALLFDLPGDRQLRRTGSK